MSAAVTGATWGARESRLSRLLAGPAEGWLTLFSVVVLVTTVGWSIDDAKWVRGVDSVTDFLPLAGLAGIAFGFAGPKLGWGRWTTHALGIAFAAIVLPIIAGGLVLGDAVTGWGPGALAARYREAAQVVVAVWVDLGIRGLPLTSQYGHYFIALGAILWATGQFAAYAVFGHRRALDAVVVVGLVLIANMSITDNDQLHLIVLYTMAALALLARGHAFDEQTTWLRRRIGDPATVTRLYLRGGAIFISAAVVGSLFLTATASSAPLQGLWRNVPGMLVDASQWLQRYLPLGGNSRDPGVVVFGETAALSGSWSQSDRIAFTAQVPVGEPAFKWRVGAYAQFNLTSWSYGDPTRTTEVTARDDLLADFADDPLDLAARREVRAQVTPQSLSGSYVVSPADIRWIDQAARVTTIGTTRWFSTVTIDGASTYTVDALIPESGISEGSITANRLRVASRDYSTEIQRLYLAVPDGAIGPAARAVLDDVLSRTPDDNPYDVALAMQNYLLDPSHFTYDANIVDAIQERCAGISSVECFALIRKGYCQYYASTMAILLREHGIPTRLVQGFLPGQRTPGGTETVRNAAAHAWVEVYFPGYGWVEFDPTGGGVGDPPDIVNGPAESPTPRPSFNLVTDRPGFTDEDGPGASPRASGAGGPTDGSGNGPAGGPFIVIGVLLLVGAIALASIAWRRGPRPMHPDRAWGSIAALAARFGLAPRASQTVYEYAGALGDAVPGVRPELSTVAHAKVEIAYGRRQLGDDRLRAVAEAHRRLRLGLLRLAFRRPRRRGPRGIR